MAPEVETWWVLPAGLVCFAAVLLLLLLVLAKKNHPVPKDLTLSTSGETGRPSSNSQRRLVLEILMSSGRTKSFRLKLEADAANFTALTNLASSFQSAANGCPCDPAGAKEKEEEEQEEEQEARALGVPKALHKARSVTRHVTLGMENNVPGAEAEGNYGGLEAVEGNYGGLEAKTKMSGDDLAGLGGVGCEPDWADDRAEKKRRRRRRRRKKKAPATGELVTGRGGEEEEGELGYTCGKWKGGDCHEGSCTYPFTSLGRGSVMQRRIKQQYDELLHSNTAGPLTLAQVGRFTNCLVEAKTALLQKSETIQRKFTIAKSLLVKADKSSFDRLCGQVPEAIVQKTSPLYNKGRVWINRGRQDIAEAYSKQAKNDLNDFINCRAQEIAPGGVMFLCMMGRPDTWPPAQQVSVGGEFCGQDFEDAWDELVTQGIISSDVRDSFNLPWYFPNAYELREAVENCGAFDIESVQVCEGVPSMAEEDFEEYIRDPKMFGLMKANMVKSFTGSLVEAHIGKKCSNKFFQVFREKAAALLHCNPPCRLVTCTVASLIRK